MKTITRILVAISAAAFVSYLPAHAEEIRILRLGYTMNETSNQGLGAAYFADAVNKVSKGRLTVTPVADAKLGPEGKALSALTSGGEEMALVSTTALVSAAKGMALWDAPFLFDNDKEANAVLDSSVGQQVMTELSPSGVVGLAYWEFGFRQITNSQRDVTRMEDLQGLKLRVPPALSDTFATLGAIPASVPFPKIYSALKSKGIDGQEHPLSVILNARFYEVQDHLTLSNHAYGAWVLLISKSLWASFSVQDRELLMRAARASRDFERKDTRDEDVRTLETLRSKGVQISVLPAAEARRMRDQLRPVRAAIAVQVTQKLWADTQTIIERTRAIP